MARKRAVKKRADMRKGDRVGKQYGGMGGNIYGEDEDLNNLYKLTPKENQHGTSITT